MPNSDTPSPCRCSTDWSRRCVPTTVRRPSSRNRPVANLNLATTYLQMDEANHAIVFAEKAVEFDPDNGPAWVNLGVAYERSNAGAMPPRPMSRPRNGWSRRSNS